MHKVIAIDVIRRDGYGPVCNIWRNRNYCRTYLLTEQSLGRIMRYLRQFERLQIHASAECF